MTVSGPLNSLMTRRPAAVVWSCWHGKSVWPRAMIGAWKPKFIGAISFLESHRVTEREEMTRGYSGLLKL
jgi:hypothetical protein